MVARERDPVAIGPILGELSVKQGIPGTIIADMIGTNSQTIFRWFFGQSEVQVYWLPDVTKVFSLLYWRRMKNALPLIGTNEQRRQQLERDVVDFKAAIKNSERIVKSGA